MNAITFGFPSALLHFGTPGGGWGEERKDRRKGNHRIAFGTREKGVKGDGKGGGSVREGTKQWAVTQPAVVCAIVVSASRRES